MTRRHAVMALTLGAMANGTASQAVTFLPAAPQAGRPKQTLHINLGVLDHVEVQGPNGQTQILTVNEVWAALTQTA